MGWRRAPWTGGCSPSRATGKTIDEIGLALHATDFHLYQRLYALARQGVVRAAPARIAAAAAAEPVARGRPHRPRARAPRRRAAPRTPSSSRRARWSSRPASDAARSLLGEAERVLGREAPRRAPRSAAHAAAPHRRGTTWRASGSRRSDKYLLSRCDGRRDVRELARVAPLRELEVLKAIRRFADAGLVELG